MDKKKEYLDGKELKEAEVYLELTSGVNGVKKNDFGSKSGKTGEQFTRLLDDQSESDNELETRLNKNDKEDDASSRSSHGEDFGDENNESIHIRFTDWMALKHISFKRCTLAYLFEILVCILFV